MQPETIRELKLILSKSSDCQITPLSLLDIITVLEKELNSIRFDLFKEQMADLD